MSKGMPPLSDAARNFKMGIYEHFKGGRYAIVCIAQHSETMEELVVYKSIDRGYICARPLSMFLDTVERDGYKGPRFKYIA